MLSPLFTRPITVICLTVVLLIRFLFNKEHETQETSMFAIIVPFTARQKISVELSIKRWAEHEYFPSTGRYKTDLILYYNLDDSDRVAHDLQTSIRKLVKDNMFNVKLVYANLTKEEDVYPIGPSNMFYNILETESIRKQYTHVFFMEPDTVAIRRGWLDAIRNITLEQRSTPFWACGSENKGLIGGTARHINGNGIYSTSEDFLHFLRQVRKWKLYSYDYDMFEYLYANPHIKAQNWDKFYFNDFIFNMYKTHYSEKAVREANPRTYLVHSGINIDDAGIIVKSDARLVYNGGNQTSTPTPTPTLTPSPTTTATATPTQTMTSTPITPTTAVPTPSPSLSYSVLSEINWILMIAIVVMTMM